MITQTKYFTGKGIRTATLVVGMVAMLAILAFVQSATAASFFWVGGGSTASAPAGGNWDAATTDWSTTASGSPTVAWGAAGSTAVFGGVDGTYGVSVNATVNKPQVMQFNVSGYTLSNAATPQTISFNSTGAGTAPNIVVAAGKVATIGTNVTVASTVTTIWGSAQGTAGGELDIANGGTLSLGNSTIGMVGINTVTSVKTGGKLSIGSGGAANLIMGSVANDNCTISVDGGAVTFGSTGTFKVGGNGSTAAVIGTLTVNAGSFAFAPANAVALTLGFVTSSLGTNNLNGGVESVNAIIKGAGNGCLNFNGGTLQAVTNTLAATFLNGLTAANVRNGGAVIDNNGFGITIGQALLHSSIVGDNATDGGLVSLGGGTNTLAGASTYNGPTVVKSGTLVATTASTGGGAYSVSNNATLGVTVATVGGSLAASALTLGTTSGDALSNNFAIGANSSTTTAPLAVSGALALNGTVTVNVSGSSFTGPNTYPLISYGSISGSGNFVAGTLPVVAGYIVSLTNDLTANKLELILTLPPPPESWAVGDGAWDITTFNWVPLGGGSATNYNEGALVVFDDSASGTSPITVTLAGNRTSGVITNSSTKNYVFTGGFNISAPQLIKDGSGTLTLDNGGGNSLGDISINSGVLQVGNGDTGGSLGSGAITNNATLQFNRTDTVTAANVISGTGGVTQGGSGAVTLSGANTYTGNTVINAGKLTTTTASKGAGAYSVADGATLEVQVAASGASLTNSALTLGTSGSLTNIYTLGSFASTTIPAVTVNGALALNGAVSVSVTGSGLVAGTYPLMAYGSISGSGSFVLSSAPSLNALAVTLTNDTTAKQLKLVVTSVSSMTWDSGNTANGATIDAASGTWDTNLGNLVWNDGGVNRPWVNGVAATFGGVDGAWAITLAANVSPSTIGFINDGYSVSAASPQTITLGNGFGATPNVKVDASKTAFIGTNVTLQAGGANNIIIGGTAGTSTPGGKLEIDNGGTVQLTGNATLGLVGIGTSVSVKTGGVFKRTSSGSILLGSLAGDDCTVSVDGGNVSITGSGVLRIGGNSTATNLTGTLTVNAGSFSMDAANTTVPLTLGVLAGNMGTNNLNGGTLSVNQIVKGNVGATAVVNFNGGSLKAVNGALGASFLSGLDAANVRNGGAQINNNAFAVTIGQALVHSAIAGDNATDGGLTSSGAGSLTLTGVNTYTGATTVSNGTLALGVGGSVANSPTITIAAGATFDVSAASPWTLGTSQTLAGNGTINGTVQVNGAVAPGSSIGTLSFGAMPTLNGTMVAELNRTNAQTADKIVFNGGAAFGGTLTLTNVGPALMNDDSFDLFDGALSGSFTTLNLPGGAVHWNTNDLNVGGTIVFTNASPVASNITMGVALGDTATLLVIGGKNTPTDADGDSLTIIGVTAATTGTSGFSATDVTYTASGSLGTNTFTYTVTDALGATDTKTVTVLVYNPVGFNQVSATTGGGNAYLTYLGIPGATYAFELAHSLTPPITWQPLATNIASTNGLLQFTNVVSLSPTNDFYRAQAVP